MTDADAHIRAGLAVVTGAGSGLGRALAMALSARGMRVAGIGRRADALAETGALIGAGQSIACPLDIADAGAVAECFAALKRDHGPVTILINNAAIYPKADLLAYSPAEFMAAVNINLGGTVACTLAALEQMADTGIGRILNVSTFADIAPLPGSSAYSVSKGAARIFSRVLVADIGLRLPGIVVNDWMPGMLNTTMGIADGLDPAIAAAWGAELALWHDPALSGSIFEMDCEILPPRSLKRRLLDRALLRRAPAPRRLGVASGGDAKA